ncbi:MAG: SET domain-containing protein-lysine N-methyltransferase [bacterium]
MEPNLSIKKSPIAGNGVFANEMIVKDQTIIFFTGEICSLEEMLLRVKEGREQPADPLEIEDEQYLDLDELSRTFNHSCDPNAYIRGKEELVALRDIEAGEEIAYDYSTTMNDNEEKIKEAGFPIWTAKCNCGSKICRGIIDQFKTLSKDRRDYYIQNKFMQDFMLRVFKNS